MAETKLPEPELLAECLFRADRLTELKSLPPASPQVRFWQGASCARQGRLEEAAALWCEALAQQPGFGPARAALSSLLRRMAFRHAGELKWEAAASALAGARQLADRSPATNSTSFAEGLIFLWGGRRRDAIRALVEAQQQRPVDGAVAHALGLTSYYSARAWDEQSQSQEADGAWEYTIAAWVMLMHHTPFAEEWRRHAAERYQVEVTADDLRVIWRRLEEYAAKHLSVMPENHGAPNSSVLRGNQLRGPAILLQRELKAANLLELLGGFPLPGTNVEKLVCGPLMIRFLGLERAFGRFAASLAVRQEHPDDSIMALLRAFLGEELALPDAHLPELAQKKQLMICFSQLGRAQAMLDLGRGQEALAALAEAGCPRCQASAQKERQARSARDWQPIVCAETCPDFDALNPGYAALPDKGRRLWTDAVGLAVEARLNLAEASITANTHEVRAATDHWREALRLAAMSGDREQTQRRIVETALGRVRTLEQKKRFGEAIALLEAAEAACDGRAKQEVVGRLAEVLTHRGVEHGNGKPPRWEAAIADLRRAVRHNPHSSRAVVNLGIALQGLAAQRYEQGQSEVALDLLQEAVKQLQAGRTRLPGHGPLEKQYRQAQTNLCALFNSLAVELANDKQFNAALELLDRGLRQYPEDALMRMNQRGIFNAYGVQLANSGELDQAAEVLERGLREFPDDLTLAQNLGQVQFMRTLLGRRRW